MDNDNCHFQMDYILLDRLHNEDFGVFEDIYNQYYRTLYNYGCQFGLVSDHVHDCIQDLFIELWNNKEKLAIHASIKAYLFKSLRYKIQHYIKKERVATKNISQYLKDSFEIHFDEEEYLYNYRMEQETFNRLKENILSLAPKQRELIYLIYFNKLSYEEAAAILDISKKTAYNHIYRAINNLRVVMGDVAICITMISLIDVNFRG